MLQALLYATFLLVGVAAGALAHYLYTRKKTTLRRSSSRKRRWKRISRSAQQIDAWGSEMHAAIHDHEERLRALEEMR